MVLAKATKQSRYNFKKDLKIYATFTSSKPSDVTYILGEGRSSRVPQNSIRTV
jgi:hypothetical protein